MTPTDNSYIEFKKSYDLKVESLLSHTDKGWVPSIDPFKENITLCDENKDFKKIYIKNPQSNIPCDFVRRRLFRKANLCQDIGKRDGLGDVSRYYRDEEISLRCSPKVVTLINKSSQPKS